MIISALKDGKLQPPESIAAAVNRSAELRREIDRITAQISDPKWPLRYARAADYDDWRARADGARRMFRRELHLLETWIAERALAAGAARLLVDARGVFRALEEDDALESSEIELVKKIDEFLDGSATINEKREKSA